MESSGIGGLVTSTPGEICLFFQLTYQLPEPPHRPFPYLGWEFPFLGFPVSGAGFLPAWERLCSGPVRRRIHCVATWNDPVRGGEGTLAVPGRPEF